MRCRPVELMNMVIPSLRIQSFAHSSSNLSFQLNLQCTRQKPTSPSNVVFSFVPRSYGVTLLRTNKRLYKMKHHYPRRPNFNHFIDLLYSGINHTLRDPPLPPICTFLAPTRLPVLIPVLSMLQQQRNDLEISPVHPNP